jgi:hypothetical protein
MRTLTGSPSEAESKIGGCRVHRALRDVTRQPLCAAGDSGTCVASSAAEAYDARGRPKWEIPLHRDRYANGTERV